MCTYCDVDDGHPRTQCPTRQEREIGTERQYDGDLETCPECGRTINVDVNERCWGADCDHEFGEREIRADGGEPSSRTEQSEGPVWKGLERFPAPDRSQITTFQTAELTALCPFEFGGPDHYELTIRYEADEYCLEAKSLKEWLESRRDDEISAEYLADELYRDIDRAIDPERLYVRLEQARRGGIEETVEVGNVDLR